MGVDGGPSSPTDEPLPPSTSPPPPFLSISLSLSLSGSTYADGAQPWRLLLELNQPPQKRRSVCPCPSFPPPSSTPSPPPSLRLPVGARRRNQTAIERARYHDAPEKPAHSRTSLSGSTMCPRCCKSTSTGSSSGESCMRLRASSCAVCHPCPGFRAVVTADDVIISFRWICALLLLLRRLSPSEQTLSANVRLQPHKLGPLLLPVAPLQLCKPLSQLNKDVVKKKMV